ncbi:hypothetical protein [uncultured Caulobacter sp.]|jgi:hypothetical protein|uniref:hypothetical protein n=1 Tax=uncultured Caulobacter sp. TaxID=158749 RepID=UPI00260195E4|nr:hypothetical protein [uncultured Caulobacter sp.]
MREALCQNIEVAPVGDGWQVRQAGEPLNQFESVEKAYQHALALCAELFERGVHSRVCQLAKAA